MSDVWVALASVSLAGVFAWSGSMKVLRAERWRQDLVSYRLGRPLRAVGVLLLPWIELGVAVGLLAGAARWAAALAIGLLGIFSAAIIRARLLLGTDKLGCGCFGSNRIHDYRLMLARNVGLAALATAIVVSGRGRPAGEGLDLSSPSTLLWLLCALATAAVAWILWQARQRMRRQGRVESTR